MGVSENQGTSAEVDPSGLRGARPAAQPKNFHPQLAELTDDVPSGAQWLHEIKYDGYRMLCFLDGQTARLVTRRGNDWTQRFPDLVGAALELPLSQAIFDGEVVVIDEQGYSDFQALQNIMRGDGRGTLIYYLFDLPRLAHRRHEALRRAGRPADYTVENLPRRLARLKSDPWEEFFTVRQSLSEKRRKALRALAEG